MANNQFFLGKDIAKSPAFRSLGKTAILVYLDFRMKCSVTKIKAKQGRKSGWLIRNNGEIIYTYAEAEEKGITRPTFKNALKELVEKGFIDISHSGMGGPKGDKSKYSISERWRDWGTEKFVKRTMEKDARGGRGFSVVWNDPKKRQAMLDKKKNNANIGNANFTPSSKVNIAP